MILVNYILHRIYVQLKSKIISIVKIVQIHSSNRTYIIYTHTNILFAQVNNVSCINTRKVCEIFSHFDRTHNMYTNRDRTNARYASYRQEIYKN